MSLKTNIIYFKGGLMQHTYGVINNEGIYFDTSFTLRGAKRYATINGYTRVGKRYDCGYHITILAIKTNGKWG